MLACNFKQNYHFGPWPASYLRSHAQLCFLNHGLQPPRLRNHSSPLRLDYVASEDSLALEWPCSQTGTLIVFTVNYSFLMPMVHPALTTQCFLVVKPTYSYLCVPETLETRPTEVKPWAGRTPTWATHGFQPPPPPPPNFPHITRRPSH